MAVYPNPRINHLVAALPSDAQERLASHLDLIELPTGCVLFEPAGGLLYETDAIEQHVYFPVDSIVSLLYVQNGGTSAEIAMVGNEGVVGLSLSLGGTSAISRAVVQSGGYAYRLAGHQLQDAYIGHSDFQEVMLRYTQALVTQMVQTVWCNRHHDINQQLCRWLRLSLDRLRDSQLAVPQELIASMLGVHHDRVAEAAARLQRLGAIDCRGGHITVLNRQLLEGLSCRCYAHVKQEMDRLLPFSHGDKHLHVLQS